MDGTCLKEHMGTSAGAHNRPSGNMNENNKIIII